MPNWPRVSLVPSAHAPFAYNVSPCRSGAKTQPTSGPCWRRSTSPRSRSAGLIYEPKYDGIRALVDLRPPAEARPRRRRVALYSRNGNEKTAQFPGSRATRWPSVGARLDGARCCSTARSSRSTRRAGRWVPAHPGPHSPDVAGRHRARRARPADRAHPVRSAARRRRGSARPAARRAPAAPAGARQARPRASAASSRLSEIAADDGRAHAAARAATRAGKG